MSVKNEGSEPLLLVGNSARGLAEAAYRAGYSCVTADLYADLDTAEYALAAVKINSPTITAAALSEALYKLQSYGSFMGIIYGAGFENDPSLLQILSSFAKVYGNSPETVQKIKNPQSFAQLCFKAGVDHPEISLSKPESGHCLIKEEGGSGGEHIHAVTQAEEISPPKYYQRQVKGQEICALIYSFSGQTRVLALTKQWRNDQSFRYGGAVFPTAVNRVVVNKISSAVESLTKEVSLQGLGSVDFLVGDKVYALEINPRIGSTIDVFARPDYLIKLQLGEGVSQINYSLLFDGKYRATGIFYSPVNNFIMPAQFSWPIWTKDRERACGIKNAGESICTVYAEAYSESEAVALVNRRMRLLHNTWFENHEKCL